MNDLINFVYENQAHIGVAIMASPLVYMLPLTVLGMFGNKRLKSRDELDELVVKESEKLGLDPEKICVSIRDRNHSYNNGLVRIFNDSSAEIEVNGPCANANTVRHELFHLKRVINDGKNPSLLSYLFNEEPRAVLYGAFGVEF